MDVIIHPCWDWKLTNVSNKAHKKTDALQEADLNITKLPVYILQTKNMQIIKVDVNECTATVAIAYITADPNVYIGVIIIH